VLRYVLDTITKGISAITPVVMVLWVRYVVQTVLTTAVLWPRQRAQLFRTGRRCCNWPAVCC
jgi:hypothetical protein